MRMTYIAVTTPRPSLVPFVLRVTHPSLVVSPVIAVAVACICHAPTVVDIVSATRIGFFTSHGVVFGWLVVSVGGSGLVGCVSVRVSGFADRYS